MSYVLAFLLFMALSASIFANYVLFVQLQNKSTALLAVERPEVQAVVQRIEEESPTVKEPAEQESIFWGSIDE